MRTFLAFALASAAIPTIARAYTITGGTLIEDFTTIDALDTSATTGLWNIVNHAAEATRVANDLATRPLAFGDGSDGSVATSSGYTFDTDARPNGYNFLRLSITGGTVTVRGRNPLIIRSLSTVTITPTITLNGTAGSAGTANGSTSGSSGGTAVTCAADGGAGGNSTPGQGGTGKTSTGATDTNGGVGNSGGTAGADAGSPGSGAAALSSHGGLGFDSTGFICGAGGAGGGGHRTGGFYSVGGGGGAGGGAIHITAVGNLAVGSITANGGNGGASSPNDGSNISGAGAGGNGGAIWLQTLTTLTTSSNPTVTQGSGPALNDGNVGKTRGDSSSAGTRPAGWANTGNDLNTANVAASQTSVVQGFYDLGTTNAAFFTAPTVSTTLNGGTVTTTYAGSADGSNFSTFTSDLSTLSNRGVRYLKVKFAIATAGAAGPSPQVTQLSIPITELDVRLMGGCGSLEEIQHRGSGRGPLEFALLSGLILLLGRRRHRKAGRLVDVSGRIHAP